MPENQHPILVRAAKSFLRVRSVVIAVVVVLTLAVTAVVMRTVRVDREREILNKLNPRNISMFGFSYPFDGFLDHVWTGRWSTLHSLGIDHATDRELGLVASISGLESVHVSGAQVSDSGFLKLQQLQNLKKLMVIEISISPTVVAALKRSHPQIEIWQIAKRGQRARRI